MILRAAIVDGEGRPRLLVAVLPGDDGRPCAVGVAFLDRRGELIGAVFLRMLPAPVLAAGADPPIAPLRPACRVLATGRWPLRNIELFLNIGGRPLRTADFFSNLSAPFRTREDFTPAPRLHLPRLLLPAPRRLIQLGERPVRLRIPPPRRLLAAPLKKRPRGQDDGATNRVFKRAAAHPAVAEYKPPPPPLPQVPAARKNGAPPPPPPEELRGDPVAAVACAPPPPPPGPSAARKNGAPPPLPPEELRRDPVAAVACAPPPLPPEVPAARKNAAPPAPAPEELRPDPVAAVVCALPSLPPEVPAARNAMLNAARPLEERRRDPLRPTAASAPPSPPRASKNAAPPPPEERHRDPRRPAVASPPPSHPPRRPASTTPVAVQADLTDHRLELLESGSYKSEEALARELDRIANEVHAAKGSSNPEEAMQHVVARLAKVIRVVNVNLPPEQQGELSAMLKEAGERPGPMARRRLWKTFCSSTLVSAISHTAVCLVTMYLELDEAASRRSLLMTWALQKLIIPLLICCALSLIKVIITKPEQKFLKYEANETTNLWINSAAKGMFFAFREFPASLLVVPPWAAHLVSFAIELIGAIYLLCRYGYWDADVTDS